MQTTVTKFGVTAAEYDRVQRSLATTGLLCHEDFIALHTTWKRCRSGVDSSVADACLARLVAANQGLVGQQALRYYQTRYEIDLDDLKSSGNVGLLRALHGYDVRRGTAFSVYARWWIRKEIFHTLDKAHVVSGPHSLPAPSALPAAYTSAHLRALSVPEVGESVAVEIHAATVAKEALSMADDQMAAFLIRRFGFDGDGPVSSRAAARYVGLDERNIGRNEAAFFRRVRSERGADRD